MARFDLRSVLLLSTLLLSVFCHDDSEGYQCVHSLAPEERKGLRIPETRTKAQRYEIPDSKRGQRQTGRQNIRIHVDTRFLDIPANPADQPDPNYTCYAVGQQITDQSGATFTCTANETLSATKMNFLKNFLLVDAVSTLQNALLVDPVQGNLMLSNEDCSGSSYTPTYIPQEYVDTGRPNTDVILIATARRITSDRVLAFAGPCLDDTRGRPTAGFINFNPVKLTTIRDSGYEASLATAIHEMTHALGFLESKFSQFRYGGIENNTKIPIADVVLTQSVDNGARSITKIKTPTVLEKIRKHFGCSTIDGAEIENGGGPGTAGSHWEKRIFNYEYMVGSITKRPVISEITLALLQDSGWYTANFSAADSFKWGWNEGCDFLEKKCNTWTGEGYFCSASSQTGCNFDRSGFSYCSLGNEPDLPSYYTYLDKANYGGTDTLADYCPYLVPYSNSWCFDTANAAPFTVNQGQARGENSRCFDTTLSDSLSAAQKISTCYVTYCPNNSTLAIKLDKYWYVCPIGGSIKDPGIFVGELTCPRTQIICKDAKEDTTWPTFTSIEPNTGEPEEEVTIKGTNFVPDMSIVINEPATDCEFVDTETYKCKIASQNVFTNPKHLVGTDEDVVVVHPSGEKSCVGLKAFHLEMNYAKGLAKQIGNWIKKNPAYAGIIIGALVLAIVGCCVFCWWEGRKARRGKRRDRD